MKAETAAQIARLLNRRNELTRQYTAGMVLEREATFVYEERDAEVAACIEVRKVQWYQAEILHLTVHERYEGKGLGRALIQRALGEANRLGARLAQCTIREGNLRSERAFVAAGFSKTCAFVNTVSANHVGVYQRSLLDLSLSSDEPE